ncbi:MAG: M60 family metallopeptidase [Planctomycetota bacterium]
MKQRARIRCGVRKVTLETLESRQLLAGDAPVLADDVFVAKEGASVIIEVLRNDRDAEADPLEITAVTDGDHGSVVNNSGDTVTYSPDTGFLGTDTFTYTVSDGTSTRTASVRVTINETIDGEAARDEILSFVNTLADPGGPGHMVAYGPTAFSLTNFPNENSGVPVGVIASLGSGRVIAMGDHQYLNMNSHGSTTSMEAFYTNGISWLSETTDRSIKIVTFNATASTWLESKGYTNVVQANASSLANELTDADVLVTWMGSNPSQANLDAIEAFTKQGGGLFLQDYGIGYQWWWGRATPDIPSNQLLRDAGIGFVKDWPESGTQAVNRPNGQVTSDDVLNALQDSSGISADRLEELATVYRKLNEVLPADDLLLARLDALFWDRIETINPTPATPVSDPFEQTLLRREMDLISNLPVDQVTAHRTVADVYGEVPASATRLQNHVVSVNTNHSGFLPTGLYAPAGEVVTVEVPASLVGQGYQVRISGHHDNISPRSSWNRVPYGVSRTFELDSSTVQVASAFGGAIYIDVGGQAAGPVPGHGDVDVTVSNAVLAPYFVLGQTTDADWNAAIRDYPGPFAELVSSGVSVSLPSDQIRQLDNPTALMTLWDDIVAFQDWIGGFETTRTGPDRFNIDVQISVGYLHAGYPIQGPTSTGPGIVDLDSLRASGNWGYFHELGHEMQRHPELGWGYDNPWTFSGDVEVTVNIFANAALELAAPRTGTAGWGYSAHPDETMRRAQTTVNDSSRPSFEQKDPYPFYYQLADGPWGWEGYRNVLSSYVDDQLNNSSALPSNNTEEKDQWLIRWSSETGYDLTRFMAEEWSLEVSGSARETVDAMGLPDWMPLAVDSSAARLSVLPGQSLVVDYGTAGLGLDGVATLVSVGAPGRGQLTPLGNGTFRYDADLFFAGIDTFDVTYESSVGNRQTFQVEVDILDRGVLMERFDEIGGTAVSDLTSAASYPNSPDVTRVLDALEIPSNAADAYGARVRGYVTAPETGNYTFWIASDDNGELWVSDSQDPADVALIAHVPGWTSSRQWDKFPTEQMGTVSLVAGQHYYIEALMKEGGGGDNLAVAWTGPGLAAGPQVITGDYLTPLGISPEAPRVTEVQVGDAGESRSVVRELTVRFDQQVTTAPGAEPFTILRREDNASIPYTTTQLVEENQSVFRLQFAGLEDGNYELRIEANLIGTPGRMLDGDGDGVAGGDHHFGTTEADSFFRLFGDSNGDRDVDGQDYGRFAITFFKTESDAEFDARFDFDVDGDVDGQDYGPFAGRFLTTLPFA